jgi:hypothetical protein
MARHTAVDKSILEAALIGLEQQKSEIDAKAAEIRRRLRGLPGSVAKAEAAPSAGRAKRVLSPAARKRIAAATRKRWAAYRAAKATSQAPAKKAGRKTGGARKKGASAVEPAAAA